MALFDEPAGYVPYTGQPIDPAYTSNVDAQTNRANRPVSDFRDDLNRNVREQSSLMGPSDPEDPQSKSLMQRGNQIYQSDLNQMLRGSEVTANQRKTQLQAQSIPQRAELYAQRQSIDHLNWEQTSYQREAALAQEVMKRNLYSSLFTGAAVIGGVAMAKGMYNAKNPSAVEPVAQRDTMGGGGSGVGPISRAPLERMN